MVDPGKLSPALFPVLYGSKMGGASCIFSAIENHIHDHSSLPVSDEVQGKSVPEILH